MPFWMTLKKISEVIGHLEWDRAMDKECSSLMKNHTWDLCPLPKVRKLVRVYHTKYAIESAIDKYMSCCVGVFLGRGY